MIILFPWNGISQNTAPVAVDDSLVVYTYLHDTTIFFEVLLNDFDPENNTLRICDVKRIGNRQMPFFNDTAIYFNFTSNFLNLIELEFDYRICRVDDPEIVSNYARLYVNPQLNENAPIAHNDTIEGIIGYNYQVNAIANDNDPNDDSIFFTPNQTYVINDSMLSVPVGYFNDANGEGYDVFSYRISNNTDDYLSSFDVAFVVTKVKNYQWYDSLNVNNVNARFNSFGNHFWNMQNKQQYIVPAGSGVSSMFSSTFWIGGMDEEDKLHLAGERYRQLGEDFWVGPVSATYDSLYDEYWLHIWKLNKAEIEYHKAHWWEAGYEALPDILSWPAHGDTSASNHKYECLFSLLFFL